MKLLRYGDIGAERPGLYDNGVIRDLSSIVPDLKGHWLDPEKLAHIANLDHSKLPAVLQPARIGACVGDGGKIICAGANYREHVIEAGLQMPDEPVLFMKACKLTGPTDPIMIPSDASMVDWEIELAVIIGRDAIRISEAEAVSHIAGYATFIDVSERYWQLHKNGQYMKGKSFPSFAPIGPWLVTTDEIDSPVDLSLRLCVNSVLHQNASTSDMIFSAPYLVSYISNFMPLSAGDIIATGTPSGVGMGLKPAKYLTADDVLTAEISRCGPQRHVCEPFTK